MITSAPLLVMALASLLFCDAAVFRRKRSACSNNGVTDADRKLFLDYHNEARLRVAKGIEPNRVGYMNPAKNMYKLVGAA
ncbi:hypothetical protein OESDEN_11019 [Oesophagostomum dentatum]|uniref:SCP domain-containing protein n=1 Tax=Oesophagostomum dentatum TaxID=61180 RepID=A0A0B1SW50_OESDE|nr:hypothetical protein OESDEN_11019 [Oesophagostomum dentatum]